FWASIITIFYHYCGYPLTLIILNRVRKREQIRSGNITPSISLIISAYNEEEVIRPKIENSLCLDYPEGKLEIIVASDGSTDKTCEFTREYEKKGVALYHHPERRGKNRVLNDVFHKTGGEILVFTDANGMFAKSALRELVRPFADSRVGCVCGELIYQNPNSNLVAEGYNCYWRYDQWLKRLESRLYSLLGANGSIFAVRKDLNEPLDPRVSNDMVLPIKIASHGYSVIYAPEAVSIEAGSAGEREELRRRSRIVAWGLLGVISLVPDLLRKQRGFLLFQLFSRKLIRYFFPLLLAMILVSNSFLGGPFYRFTLIAQIFPYLLVPWGYYLSHKGIRLPFLSLPYYFCVGVLAALMGLIKVFSLRELATWEGFDRRYDLRN
ncbi:MAG: glycosyltransferase family 2 protein, partial [Candidatus Binatia bacterium]